MKSSLSTIDPSLLLTKTQPINISFQILFSNFGVLTENIKDILRNLYVNLFIESSE